jgi:hypothetical protein
MGCINTNFECIAAYKRNKACKSTEAAYDATRKKIDEAQRSIVNYRERLATITDQLKDDDIEEIDRMRLTDKLSTFNILLNTKQQHLRNLQKISEQTLITLQSFENGLELAQCTKPLREVVELVGDSKRLSEFADKMASVGDSVESLKEVTDVFEAEINNNVAIGGGGDDESSPSRMLSASVSTDQLLLSALPLPPSRPISNDKPADNPRIVLRQ